MQNTCSVSILARIDHGRSTLCDRPLARAGALTERRRVLYAGSVSSARQAFPVVLRVDE